MNDVFPFLLQAKLKHSMTTMSLFHNLKLKRRKVDSRSSSDGSEAAAVEIISPPSLASSSEVSMEDHPRPSSHGTFEVEVKKFESAPRYTSWASPAKLKQEPFFTEETTTLTPATVVPKIFANGSENANAPTTTHLPKGLMLGPDHRPRLAEALRPPPANQTMVAMSSAHLPFAAAAAAAKLQAMHHHSNLVTSSAHPNVGPSPMPSPVHLHSPQSLPHPLRMTGPPPMPVAKLSPVKTEQQSPGNVVPPPAGTVPISKQNGGGGGPTASSRKQGPSVILGEHGGVKTMIWTDSTTYWQTANKYRNLQAPSQPPSQVPPAMPPNAVSLANADKSPLRTTTDSPALKLERPPDREQALKMSSAVDGLLSLSSQGQRPSPPAASSPSTVATLTAAASPSPLPPTSLPLPPPHLLHLSPAHMPHSSSPSVASTPPMSMPQQPQLQQQQSVIPSPSVTPSHQPPLPPPRRRSPMNMERLWAGDMSQLPSHVIESQNGHMNMGLRPNPDQEDEEPLLCNICEDRATGLHYGIITCEG